jgi:hypothetical protein
MNSPMNAISLTLNPPVFTKLLQDCAVRARNDVGSVTIQSSLGNIYMEYIYFPSKD